MKHVVLGCFVSAACMGLIMVGMMSWMETGLPSYLGGGQLLWPGVLFGTVIALLVSTLVGSLFDE